jgi:two-component system, NarL family, sensor histidine kinase UhpB
VEESGHRRNGAKRQSTALCLTISDDGKGIDPATPKGFGLTTMTERVKSLGGTCVIEGARGNGTTIRIEIRVQREKAERARALELVGGVS